MLVVWFVLGFAFYSLLYGSLGSLASRNEDAQAAAGPVIALVVGIYALAVMAMANPGAAWVTIVSMLPPTAPIIMPLARHPGERSGLADGGRGDPPARRDLRPVPRQRPALPERGPAHRRPAPPARSLARRTGPATTGAALTGSAKDQGLGGLARPAPACLRHHLLPESRYVIVKRSLKGQGPPDLGGYACVLASEFSTGAPPRLVVNRQGAGGGPDDWNWPLFGSPFPDSMCSLCGIVRAFRADGAMGAGAGKWGLPAVWQAYGGQ